MKEIKPRATLTVAEFSRPMFLVSLFHYSIGFISLDEDFLLFGSFMTRFLDMLLIINLWLK